MDKQVHPLMPYHVHDTRGTHRPVKRYTKRTKATDCLACNQPLTNKDRAAGCRRCKACRTKAPGRPQIQQYAPERWNARNAVPTPRKSPPVASWWEIAPRDGFTARAGQQCEAKGS
jgi:hypothetical protein